MAINRKPICGKCAQGRCRFDVVTAKAAEVADYKAFNPAALDVGHQAVKLRPVENRTRPSVIHINIDEIEIRATGNIGLAYLYLISDDIHLFRLAAVLNRETGINGRREDLQRSCFAGRLCRCDFSAFRAMRSSLLYPAMASSSA